jgi:hypothetical protein
MGIVLLEGSLVGAAAVERQVIGVLEKKKGVVDQDTEAYC